MGHDGSAIAGAGTLLLPFIADHSEWATERFVTGFPDPFLLELRRSAEEAGGGVATPPAITADAVTVGAANATNPDPQSRLLTIAKRGTMFPSKMTVGRTKNNDVVVEDAGMSKLHAFFDVRNAEYHLVDAGSRNGTFVNGTRLAGSQAVPLKSGDRVQFASRCFRYFTSAAFHAELSTLLKLK